MVLFIHREDMAVRRHARRRQARPPLAEIIIGKHRNGGTGAVKMTFIKEYTRFENYADDAEPGLGRVGRSEPPRAVDLAELAIERAERQVARLAGGLEDQAVGEPEGRSVAEVCQGRGDGGGIVHHELLVIQQLLYHVGDVASDRARSR